MRHSKISTQVARNRLLLSKKLLTLCPDPYVADQLRHLYEHPDFVEMYPGMVTESAKVPMVPGVGIAPNFTISRAILSDAVALVRGDRFYTVSATLCQSYLA